MSALLQEISRTEWALLIGVLGQLFVSVLLLRADEYDRKQQLLQMLLIWLLPILGAVIVLTFYWSHRSEQPRSDHRFTPQEPNDY